jgi:hypothetical protein
MGRKGVSKRKPHQVNAKPLSKDNTGVGGPSSGRSTGSQPVRISEADKVVNPTIRGSEKHPSDSKKNSKKR